MMTAPQAPKRDSQAAIMASQRDSDQDVMYITVFLFGLSVYQVHITSLTFLQTLLIITHMQQTTEEAASHTVLMYLHTYISYLLISNRIIETTEESRQSVLSQDSYLVYPVHDSILNVIRQIRSLEEGRILLSACNHFLNANHLHGICHHKGIDHGQVSTLQREAAMPN